MSILKNISERLKNISLFVMDVDGTMTDAAMYYSSNGEELKRFSTRDGMGIVLLNNIGIITAIITSENSEIVTARAKKLNINKVILNSKNKLEDLKKLSSEYSIPPEQISYIGDDINDIEAIKWAGIGACPNDAVQEVRNVADYICSKAGGFGAVRELADLILKHKQ